VHNVLGGNDLSEMYIACHHRDFLQPHAEVRVSTGNNNYALNPFSPAATMGTYSSL